ncbi:MAG: cyclic nucleotide-binding domain-containing protein [Candidatus Obscuribacterales bacterium]
MIESLQDQEREQLVQFLKERSILRLLDDRIIHGLSLSLVEKHCGPGHIVFKEGDPGDGLYIIRHGSVEVKRKADAKPIAYLTAGECFGEMSLLNNQPRTATIRVPEEAVILKLSKKASIDLKSKFPVLGEELENLAEQRDGKRAFKAPGLEGNTAFFDLPTVIQAVASSRQSGKLNIFPTHANPGSKLVFDRGNLISANFKHLTGDCAVFELLAVQDPADFAFERSADNDGKPVESTLDRPIERLLVEGARRSDEMPKLMEKVGGINATFSTPPHIPKWKELPDSIQSLAPKIWKLIELDLSVEEILPLVAVDSYSILQTLSEMVSLELIKPVITAAPEADAPEEVAYRRGDTAEIDLRRILKQSTKLARTLYALNMVAANLSNIVDTATVQYCLDEALRETTKTYPQLSCLKVHTGGKTLDVRGASSELSSRVNSAEALTMLTNKFLQLMSDKQTQKLGKC